MTSTLTRTLATLVMALLTVTSVLIAGVGPAVAADEPDHTIPGDGDRVWLGQEVLIEDVDLTTDTPAELYRNGETEQFVTELAVHAADADTTENYVVLDSESVGAGEYMLEQNGHIATFTISEQTLTVTAEDEVIADDNDKTQFDIESNRVGSVLNVSADGLDAEEIYTFFGGDGDNSEAVSLETDGDTDYVQIDTAVLDDGALPVATTGDIPTGEYTFEFAVTDSTATASTDLEIREAGSGYASFDRAKYAVGEGDVTTFNVTLENRETATLHFGDESEEGYEAEVGIDTRAVEGNTVTVEFNSFLAGNTNSNAPGVAFSGEGVELRSESPEDVSRGVLESHEYGMELTIDGTSSDLATMAVTDHAKPTAETYVAQGSVETASYEGLDLRSRTTVAPGDSVVVVFDNFEFDGLMQDGVTAADLDLDDGTLFEEFGIGVSVAEQNPGVNQDATELSVDSYAIAEKDAEANRMVLVLDMGETAYGQSVAAGEEYAATLHIDANKNPYLDASEFEGSGTGGYEATTEFSVVERSVEFDHAEDENGVLQFQQKLDGTVRVEGRSTAAPGTEYEVALRSDNAQDPVIKRGTAEVSDDGTFAVNFNLSDRGEGFEFSLDINSDEYDRGPVDGVIVTEEQPDPETHTLDVTVENEAGEELDADVLVEGERGWGTFEEGSTVTIKANADGYAPASETIMINDDTTHVLTLEEAEAPPEPETYAFTVTVTDEDGTPIEDAEVKVNGESEWGEFEAGAEVTVSADAEGYTATSEEVEITEDTQHTLTLEENQTEGPSEPESTEEEGPGFDVVVTTVAVLVAALLARRRV